MAINPPQIQQRLPFVDKNGTLTNDSLRTLNDAFKQLTSLILEVADLAGVQIPGLDTAIQAANDAAAAANAAAAAAQGASDENARASNLANSYVDDPGLITAFDAGSSVTVAIAAHNRIYGDGTSVAVASGNVSGLSYGVAHYIFYDDVSRSGGSVTYQAATDPYAVAQVGDRHSVGYAPPIAALDPSTPGNGVAPPGGSYSNI